MTYEFHRILRRMAALLYPEKVDITGLAFLPDHLEAPNCWHLNVHWADGPSLRYSFNYDEPTFSKKDSMMAAYEAASACLRELEEEA
jgi:hypothetical protein